MNSGSVKNPKAASLYLTNTYILLTTQFVCSFCMYRVIRTLFLERNGLALYQIGFVLSAYQVGKLVFEVPTGFVADKYGRKTSVLAGFVLLEIFLVLTFLYRSFPGFAVAYFLQGVGLAFISGALDGLYIDSVIAARGKESLPRFSALNRVVFWVAIGSSSLLGGRLALVSYESVWKASIIIQLLSIPLLLLVCEPSAAREERPRQINLKIIRDYMCSNKAIQYFVFMSPIIAVSMVPVDSYYPNFLKSLGLNEMVIGAIMFLQFTLSAATGFWSDKLTRRIGGASVVRTFPLLMTMCYLLFAVCRVRILLLFFYLSGLVVFCLFAPVRYKHYHSALEAKYRATVLSIESLLISVVATIVQPFFGYLAQSFGYSLAFSALLCLSLVLLLVNNWKYASLEYSDQSPS